MRVASSVIFSLMLSRRRRSTALWLSRRRRRFSFAIIALGTEYIRLSPHTKRKRSTDYDSLFSGCILRRVCSNVFRTNPACTRCAETAKGTRAEAVGSWERELLVPCASRVHREWGDGEGRGRLAVGGDEDCVWVRAMAMPRRGGGANAAAFRTSSPCRTPVG
jgi:hypothetical protein